MKAIIVAAGKGNRLKPLTNDIPKPLLEIEGKSLIERSIENLHDNGIDDITAVVGYMSEKIRKKLKDRVNYIENLRYNETNNMYSLWCARDIFLDSEFLYLHADILYHPEILKICLSKKCDTLSIVSDHKKCGKEEMKVRVDENHRLIESSKDIPTDQAYGEFIGITRISEDFTGILLDHMQEVIHQNLINVYDTYVFTLLAKKGFKIDICDIDDYPWIEIDFIEDWNRALNEIFPKINS